MRTVRQMALRDISEDVKVQRNEREANRLEHECGNDSWFLGRKYLETIQTNRLNRALGLHKINK